MSINVPLPALRWSYCTFIAAASVSSAYSALHHTDAGAHPPAFVVTLASIETIAAIAFVARANVVACGVLLIVYAVAGIVSLLSSDWLAVLRFTFFAVTAAYIAAVQAESHIVALAAEPSQS